MNLSPTKQRIIEAAIRLFNEDGFANVRLQSIADRTGISVGNLAYHYKNKEAIVEQVYEVVGQELQHVLADFRQHPSLLDLEHQLHGFHRFIHRYPFYFADVLEIKRSFPYLHEERQRFANKIVLQIRKRFEYNVNRGVIIPEPVKGQYELAANTIWMLITFWVSQNQIKGAAVCNIQGFKASIWGQIIPYLTERGKEEHKNLILETTLQD